MKTSKKNDFKKIKKNNVFSKIAKKRKTEKNENLELQSFRFGNPFIN